MTALAAHPASVDSAQPAHLEFEISVALVDIAADHRKHADIAVRAMAEDMAVRGQLQAIEVIATEGRYRLVFGRLRLEAIRLAGQATIRALVRTASEFASESELRLRSISENMHRVGLTALDRSVAIADWCSIYRAAQPALKPGPKPAELSLNFRLNSDEALMQASESFAASFSEAAQAFLGISRAAVFRALRIASIPSLQRDRIALHALARLEGELYALGGIKEADRQVQVIDLILSNAVQSVEQALARIDGRIQTERSRWERMSDKFGRLQEAEQDRFFDLQAPAIDRWKAKRGHR